MALREFNHCRRDPEWKEKAVYQMIEIFLNPENETLGGDAMDATDKIDAEKSDTELLGVLTADKLLQVISALYLDRYLFSSSTWMNM